MRTRKGEMKDVLPMKFKDDGCKTALPKLDKKLARKIFKATKVCR